MAEIASDGLGLPTRPNQLPFAFSAIQDSQDSANRARWK